MPSAAAVAPPAPPSALPLTGQLRSRGVVRLPSIRTRQWIARGAVKVVADVEIESGDLRGTVAIGGRCTAERLESNGALQVGGEVAVSGPLRIRGSCSAGAGLHAASLWSAGRVSVAGDISVRDSIEWHGSLESASDVQADSIQFSGQLAVQGMLSSRSISGAVTRRSFVTEIRAGYVDLRLAGFRLPMPIPFLPPPPWRALEVQRVEAVEAHLSGVRVLGVKADRIWLGPGTHVQYVEGTIVERHRTARVGPESESPPPPGLSR